MGAGALCQTKAYHKCFPAGILVANHPLYHIEALNYIAATKQWAPSLTGAHVTIHCDSAIAVVILQVGMA